MFAYKDPDGFTDPCDIDSRVDLDPGADAFVRHFRETPGFTVVSTSALTVGGYPAVQVTLDGDAGYACDDGYLYELVPSDQPPQAGFYLGPGDRDVLDIVDVGSATLAFSITPFDAPAADAIISSITFPDPAPVPVP